MAFGVPPPRILPVVCMVILLAGWTSLVYGLSAASGCSMERMVGGGISAAITSVAFHQYASRVFDMRMTRKANTVFYVGWALVYTGLVVAAGFSKCSPSGPRAALLYSLIANSIGMVAAVTDILLIPRYM